MSTLLEEMPAVLVEACEQISLAALRGRESAPAAIDLIDSAIALLLELRRELAADVRGREQPALFPAADTSCPDTSARKSVDNTGNGR